MRSSFSASWGLRTVGLTADMGTDGLVTVGPIYGCGLEWLTLDIHPLKHFHHFPHVVRAGA